MSAVDRAALAKIIEEQRQTLFRAGAVVSVCAIACINDTTDPDELADALRHRPRR